MKSLSNETLAYATSVILDRNSNVMLSNNIVITDIIMLIRDDNAYLHIHYL